MGISQYLGVLIYVTLIALIYCKQNITMKSEWREDICYANSFDSVVNLYVKQGIRWRIPELKAHDVYEKEYSKRKELFYGILDYYCKDKVVNEVQILQFDECFNIAFSVDPTVTDFCRKKVFIFPGDVKEADCSEDDTKEGEEFRTCITHEMRLKNPKFDLFDHAKTGAEKHKIELSKWLKKRSLKCMRRIFHTYLDDLQSDHDWPIWGNIFYYE